MLVMSQFRIKDLTLTQIMMVLAMVSSMVILTEISPLVVVMAVVSVPVHLLVAMTFYHLQSLTVTVSHCCCCYYRRLARMSEITMLGESVIVMEVSLAILTAVSTLGSPVMVM
jgi:hypothetical protein